MQTQTEDAIELEKVLVAKRQIVVYNDDFNTFDFVIESLIKICKQESTQAVQCTYIIHFNGKCSVKEGAYKELEPICTALLERGLTAEII
jgi:ATP-dependent Clp protease adaptor protein ClpS